MNDDSITRFALLRHAETVWNQKKRIQGQQDTPITPQGQIQARQWGRRLKSFGWNRILTSDAGRAIKTAEFINETLHVPVNSEARLREQDWGEWTGRTIAQLKQESPKLLAEQEAAGWGFCPPDGEVREHVWHRSQAALQEAGQKWPGDHILVITHEGVIKSLIYRLYERQFLPTEPPLLRPGHLHWLLYDRQGFRVEAINAFRLILQRQ